MKHVFVIETEAPITEGVSEHSMSAQNHIHHAIERILQHERILNGFVCSNVNQTASQVLCVPNALTKGGEVHLSVGEKSAVQVVPSSVKIRQMLEPRL